MVGLVLLGKLGSCFSASSEQIFNRQPSPVKLNYVIRYRTLVIDCLVYKAYLPHIHGGAQITSITDKQIIGNASSFMVSSGELCHDCSDLGVLIQERRSNRVTENEIYNAIRVLRISESRAFQYTVCTPTRQPRVTLHSAGSLVTNTR